MKQEVNFKVDLENRKDLKTNVVYTEEMIEYVLNNSVGLTTRTREGKTGYIGELENIELVYICDSIVRFKCILNTPVTINLVDLDINLYFIHVADDPETEITIKDLIGVNAYFVNRKIENIINSLSKYKLVNKSNNLDVLSGEVLFEDINDYVILEDNEIKEGI